PDLQEAVSLDHNRHDRSLLVHAIRYYPALAVDRQGSVTAAIGPSPRIQAQSAWAMASLLGASSPLGARVCGATGMQIDSAARFRGGGRGEKFRVGDGRGGPRPPVWLSLRLLGGGPFRPKILNTSGRCPPPLSRAFSTALR